MDTRHLYPHFSALDIILSYLNRGNSAIELGCISSIAKAWCQQYHHHLLDLAPSGLDEVLWTHPFLFDLSIRSFARLFSFDDSARNEFARNTSTQPCRINITTRYFFAAMLDAYIQKVEASGRWLHDRILARDLKTSPIIHHIPEVIHRIAGLNVDELFRSEPSTIGPKISTGFSSHPPKTTDIVMIDAPPVNPFESKAFSEVMDVDDSGHIPQAAYASRKVSTDENYICGVAFSARRKVARKRDKNCRRSHQRRRHSGGVRKKRKRRRLW